VTYNELFETIKGYTENDFPSTQYGDPAAVNLNFTSAEQVNTFIRQAEQRIYNSVQFPSIRKNVTGLTTINNKYLSSPGDFLSVFSMAVIDPVTGAYDFLLNKDVNFIRAAYPIPTEVGKPEYYALFGPTTTNDNPPNITNELSFILGPTPNAIYEVELHYYFYPESIVTAGQTWLGDNFDSVLLYASLLEAYTYMKGEADVIANYEKRYNEALILAKRLGDGMERSDAYRSGQFRMPNLPQNSAVR
jgi:hypothetical protein